MQKRRGQSPSHLSDRARIDVCPQCGGLTDRPYLDCSRCREMRRRMTSEERRATWAHCPGLDGDELAAWRIRDEDEIEEAAG